MMFIFKRPFLLLNILFLGTSLSFTQAKSLSGIEPREYYDDEVDDAGNEIFDEKPSFDKDDEIIEPDVKDPDDEEDTVTEVKPDEYPDYDPDEDNDEDKKIEEEVAIKEDEEKKDVEEEEEKKDVDEEEAKDEDKKVEEEIGIKEDEEEEKKDEKKDEGKVVTDEERPDVDEEIKRPGGALKEDDIEGGKKRNFFSHWFKKFKNYLKKKFD